MASAETVPMQFDHVSIAVKSIDRALDFFVRYFPVQPRNDKQSSDQVRGSFWWQDFYLGGVAVELIEDPPGVEGFITRYIRRYGEGLHHLCYETERLDLVVEVLARNGVQVVDAKDFPDGARTAFISPRTAFGTLIQFWHLPNRDEPAKGPAADGRARFDHVAIAVKDIERAMRFFARCFPGQVRESPIPRQRQGDFILAHMELADSKLEFIQSKGEAGSDNDFVGRFIERHGEGLHHIAVEVQDFDGTLARLKADGVRTVSRETNWRGCREFLISPQAAFGTLIQVGEAP
jgi:methylmalonyl-CoA/ethylmalonyl-CoA epimerase